MFRFVRSDFVVAGTFNIYVLNPTWFTQVGLFEAGEELAIQTDFSRPGYRYVTKGSNVEWTVSPEKVVAASHSWSDDCGEVIWKVIEKLEWTPLVAVGSNLVINGDRADLKQLLIKPPVLEEDSFGTEWKESRSTVSLERDDRVFNIGVAATPEQTLVTVNINTDLSKIMDRTERLRAAKSACSSFARDRRTAIALVETLLGVEVEYDGNVLAT